MVVGCFVGELIQQCVRICVITSKSPVCSTGLHFNNKSILCFEGVFICRYCIAKSITYYVFNSR